MWYVKESSLLNGDECWAQVNICSSSPAMVTSPCEWKILEWDEKHQANNLFSCLSDGTLDGAPCQWLQPPWHTKHHIPEFSKKLGSQEPLGKLQADNFSILVTAFRESKLSGIPLLEFSRIVHFFFGIRQSSTLQSASLTPHVPSSQHFQQAYCISLTWILNLYTAILSTH